MPAPLIPILFLLPVTSCKNCDTDLVILKWGTSRLEGARASEQKVGN
jgi:hypothetical protein